MSSQIENVIGSRISMLVSAIHELNTAIDDLFRNPETNHALREQLEPIRERLRSMHSPARKAYFSVDDHFRKETLLNLINQFCAAAHGVVVILDRESQTEIPPQQKDVYPNLDLPKQIAQELERDIMQLTEGID